MHGGWVGGGGGEEGGWVGWEEEERKVGRLGKEVYLH